MGVHKILLGGDNDIIKGDNNDPYMRSDVQYDVGSAFGYL